MSKFTFYTDPGHGWLKVTTADLAKAGLSQRHFSEYSYRDPKDGSLYLEEDCDASIFRTHWMAKFGTFEATDVYQEHTFIRSLPRLPRGDLYSFPFGAEG